MNNEQIYRQALSIYGRDNQIAQLNEEMSELSVALSKVRRGRKEYIPNVAEEIGDVLVLLEQMILYFDCRADVEKWVEQKTDRLARQLSLETDMSPSRTRRNAQMKYFKNEKIVIRTGAGVLLNLFLEMCEDSKLRWLSGRKATEYKPNSLYGNSTCICCNFDGHKRLTYGPEEQYAALGYQVIDFFDFLKLDLEGADETE